MSGRSARRLHGGFSSGSQQDLRSKRRELKVDSHQDDDMSSAYGGGDGRGKSEEVRISRLTRLLARLDNEESFFTICSQIEGALSETENQKYVCRCFQCLCPSFLEVFKGLGGLPWETVGTKRFALLLSNICKAMDKQTSRFFQWIVDIVVRTARGSQTYVSSSAYVIESVSIHLISLLDSEDIVTFTKCVYEVLEDVSNPRVFRVLGAIFVCGTNFTSDTWRNPHFQDFIDMVVGWMVDVRQTHDQFACCSELLENSKCQFLKDLRFLVTLMSQILEDLEQAIKKVQPTSNSDSEEFQKVLQLIRAFTSLLSLECAVDKAVITEFCDRLVSSTLQFIRMSEPHRSMDRKYRFELLSTVNKALFYAGGVLGQSITKYFRAQLKLGTTNSSYIKWPKLFLSSFLESMAVWVEVAVSQTQLSEDILDICSTLLNMMDDMHDNLAPYDQHYVVSLVVALLRTRNVNLLQKTYKWLIAKLPYDKKMRSKTVEEDSPCLFVLAGLADIIGNKGSLLTLWVLQPTVLELLIDITNMNVHPRTQHCAMDLLKTHCSVHSHFVSSIASTGTFNTESPGTRFLPALMSFWLEKLQALSAPEDTWMAEWIFEFLQSTNSYSSLLYETKPEFYEGFLQLVTQKSSLLSYGVKILEWFSEDAGYAEVSPIQDIICEKTMKLLFNDKAPQRLKHSCQRVLYNLPRLLVNPGELFLEDCAETDVDFKDSNNPPTALMYKEFNLFLYELLIGTSEKIPKLGMDPIDNLLSVVADHLLRLKLKTPLGKPQDFFGHLLLVFKRSRASKIPVPSWKLHFVFELEKKFQLWIHGSAVDETDLTEHVKTFYLLNKSPFLEWLKRIRSDIIENCILSGEYSMAYFNAALMGDLPKMESALFQITDALGLKGMGNIIAYYYLEGKYEEAINLLNNKDNIGSNSSTLHEEIKELSSKILEDSLDALQKWNINDDSRSKETENKNCFTLDLSVCAMSSLIDLQMQNYQKKDLSILDDIDILETLKLPTLQKMHACLQKFPEEIVVNNMENFESIRMNKMLEAGNITYVKDWLVKKGIDLTNILTDEDLNMLRLSSLSVSTLNICADLYARTMEHRKSVILYNILREVVTGSLESADLANKVTLSLCSRILESNEFFASFNSESLSLADRLETLKSLHQVALQSFPECAKTWVAFGDFAYSQSMNRNSSPRVPETEMQNLKYTAVECYGKYVQLANEKETHGTKGNEKSRTLRIVAMTRLLQLFREGYQFTPEDIINSQEWLMLLAEISQIPELRSFVLEKYPDQAALFMTSHDCTRVTNKFAVKRRNLFDLSPYAFVDTTEEPLSSNVILSNLSQLEKLSSASDIMCEGAAQFPYKFRSDLNLAMSSTIFAQELLRLASSMEDMWVWSLERIAVDWSRRLTYLRKECTRSVSLEKILIFIQPIITYLEALLVITVESDNPADVNFTNRHKTELQKYLDHMSSSKSLEDVSASMNALLKYSERFGLLINNRLPVSHFSRKLSNPEFYKNSEFSMCLPGQPSHLKITGIHATLHALPTKTKPKRIRLLASNGKLYDYLVKGTENLNIDCGVMQLLKVAQSFLNLPTRTYSITPLGKRGGLIQIVPEAIPLFTLYKRHLQRNKSMEKTSEMFWSRMSSLGYEDRSNLAALREVYESLSSETSCDLITRELLLCAETPSQWLQSVQTFTKDCSVGSGVGYLLGIGDRHLDNMLVNVNRGKFIHVDFTIIFGKGTTLRVPERVPFRLTQNLSSVLQFPGPTGVFSVVLQDVLSLLQEYRSTVVHLVKNIAFSHQYDEDSPVDLTKVLLSELKSTVELFLCRVGQDLITLEIIRSDVQEIMASDNDSTRKIYRKMNRWRRMLVNLNTTLQFVCAVAQTSGPFENVIPLIQNEWTKHFQLSLESGMEQPTAPGTSFLCSLDETEKLLNDLKTAFNIAIHDSLTLDVMKLQESNIQIIDTNKMEVLVKYAEMNIQAFNPSTTVSKLVSEATCTDNLAQMYEGWTPWV